MSFESPVRLWLFIGIAALAATYVVLQYRRRTYALRFSNVDLIDKVAPHTPGWRRHVPAAAFLIAMSLLVTAFANPQRDERVPRERASVIMAIDVSLSMEAKDVDPTRIAAAKDAAKAFLGSVPDTINVGLVSFAEFATVRVAPTTNRTQVETSIENLTLGPSTAIGEAIFAGLDALTLVPPDEEGTPPPGVIVLMSDGTTTAGRLPDVAVQAALEANVPISTIAFGTDAGIVEIPNEVTGQLEQIPVPVDDEELARIARQSNGQFFTAADADELRDVYTDIGSSIGFETEQRSISGWFVGFALIAGLVTALLSLLWFQRLP